MMISFLQEAFSRFGGVVAGPFGQSGADQLDSGFLAQAVERVVDETYPRLRAVPGYRRRLEGPVTDAFVYIDELVERMPESFLCSRSAFSTDPRVKAFFVNPRHMHEVFSQSKDVRDLFDANPQAEECCTLVCMRMEERQKFGVALTGDSVHREVMQTSVSFSDHQVYTPGESDTDARRALKCCIFTGILNYAREKLGEAKTGHFDEGTSSRDFARDRRSFRRRRRSGCCISCGRGLTSFVTAATRCRTPLVGRADGWSVLVQAFVMLLFLTIVPIQ